MSSPRDDLALMRFLRLSLLLSAAALALVAVIFSLTPASPGIANERMSAASTPLSPPTVTPADPALAEDVVLANVFSARRSPPTSRYSPPDAVMDTAGGMVEMPTDAPGADAAPAGTPLLLGTVVGAQGTQALLQLDPYAGQPRLYSVGDRDAGFRVVSISPRSAVLVGPQGRVTVRLGPEEERP